MSDMISRKAAIEAAKFYETFCDPFPRVIESLEALPDAQEWIPVDIDNDEPKEAELVLMGIRHEKGFKYAVTMRTDNNFWHGLGRDIIGEMRYMPLPDTFGNKYEKGK